jgi:hypothetical protein
MVGVGLSVGDGTIVGGRVRTAVGEGLGAGAVGSMGLAVAVGT